MTSPTYINPLDAGGLAVVNGAAGSGRTFLCELLAAQARLGGFRVTYISSDSAQGRGFATLSSSPRWAPHAPGDLDPFRWAPPAIALELHRSHVAGLELSLSAEEQEALRAGFSRAAVMGRATLSAVLELADSAAVAAKVLRALRKDPRAALLYAESDAAPAELPEALWVDLSALSGSPAGLAAAALTAHVAAQSTRPHLVVLDGFEPHLSQAAWRTVLQAAHDNPAVAVVAVGTRVADLPQILAQAAHRFALAGDDPDALSFVGMESTGGKLQWLAGAGPVLESGAVVMPAACIYRDPAGATTSVDVGPWGPDVLAALTSGAASRYA